MNLVDIKKVFLAIFMSGLVVGIIYVNIWAADYLSITGIFNANYLNEYLAISGSSFAYILYLLRIRMLPLVILGVLVQTKMRRMIVYIFFVWTGFLWGIYTSMGVVVLGVKGVLFCVIALFPHMICYIPAYLILLVYMYDYPQSSWNIYKASAFVACLVVGIFLESMVNPVILGWIIPLL